MEVKVQCPCGTRYKFDVEPIHEHMPGPVSCPTCGADGTAASEAILLQSLNARVASPSAGSGQTASAEKPRIRLHIASPNASGSAQAVGPMAPIAGPESTAHLQAGRAAALAVSPPRESHAPRPVTALVQSVAEPKRPKGSFGLGILGAVLGTLLSAAI